MNSSTIDRTTDVAARAAGDAAAWAIGRLHPVGDASASLEAAAFLDSFTPSLMPRTSQHQGLAAGLHVLGARFVGSRIDALQTMLLGAAATTPASLAGRALTFAAGHAAASIPEQENETLWRSGVRAGGEVVRAAAVSGAMYDVVKTLGQRSGSRYRPLLPAVVFTGGALYWAARRLRHRQEVIPRWPVEQTASVGESTATAAVVAAAGTGIGKAFLLTRRGLGRYFGPGVGRTAVARAVNTAAWAGAATMLYNAAIASIGRANEKVEPAYAEAPASPLVSGSPDSVSAFAELGQQGRRFVTDVVTPGMITDVMQEPEAEHPIRVYVGFNSIPLYQSGRAEMALDELERTGAFDRKFLLLVSPTGTGWVDQTVVEAAEFLARGDIATCSVQYGRFPSFLCVQKVGLGRSQFRLLLWGIRERLRERAPEHRPKILVFGESLGAWTSSDVVMSQGIAGFDHYGIDRALWFGLPALAKWSRNGMATGSNDLVPDGTVGVFDRHEQLAALGEEERDRLRAVVLSHDNDPIACLRPELMVQQPDWLRSDTKGRNVPDDMSWVPLNTFWQVMIDAANAMVTVPGQFGSFGHDYRGDTALMVRDGFQLPGVTDEQMERLDEALIALDMERRERLKMTWGDEEPQWSGRFPSERFGGGVPLDMGRTGGARWFR